MKKKKNSAGILLLLVCAAVGGVCGFLFSRSVMTDDLSGSEYFLTLGGLLLGLYAIIFAHIALHEAGHLIFGLLTGYRFGSFRLGSLMIVKENEKLRLRSFKLPGTGGQCLMLPPEPVDGKIPYALYGLGGVIVNGAVSVAALAAWLIMDKGGLGSTLLLMVCLFGLIMALSNGLPISMGSVDNDGRNVRSLKQHPHAMGSYIRQMQINAELVRGVRVKDMPAELFPDPAAEDLNNSFTAAEALFAANRLLDEQKLDQAQARLEALLAADTGLIELHRAMAVCDLIFCELIGPARPERLQQLLTKEQTQFMQVMKKNISTLRTRYALAMLADHDPKAANQTLALFEKVARSYPYPQEICSERELMALVDARAIPSGSR